MAELNFQMYRGLQTALDDVEASPGSLARAVNCEYVRRRRAIRPARGRAYLGNQTASSGQGSHSVAPVGRIVGLTWDPLTTVDGSTPELYQLMYEADDEVRTVALGNTHDDAGMEAGASRLWHSGTFGASLDTAAFENQFYVAGLGVLERGETGQRRVAHGCEAWGPFSRTPFYVVRSTDLSVFPDLTAWSRAGAYWYWCVWENVDTGREGAAGADDAVVKVISTSAQDTVSLYFDRDVIEADLPYPNTRIHVYQSLRLALPDTATPAVDAAKLNAWPIGYKIATIDPTTTPWTAVSGDGVSVTLGLTSLSPPLRPCYVLKDTYPCMTVADDAQANLSQARYDLFPFVTTRFGNTTANVAKNGPPPAATAYEVFDESLIANDQEDPRKTWFSYPGDPHAFPGTFYINHETKYGDRVIGYSQVRNVLGVFLRYGVERILWLPRESEVDFSRKRFRETISSERGAVSLDAIAKFLHPTLGEMIAFVSDDGVWATNIVQQGLLELTGRIEWEEHVSDPTACKLVDDPDNKRLLLVHGIPDGQYEGLTGPPTGITAIHYGEEYLDDKGRMAIIGPVERARGVATISTVQLPSGRRQVVTSDGYGSLFFEGIGSVDQATLDDAGNEATALPMLMTSKQIYPGGLLREIEIGMMGVRSTGPSDLQIELRTYGVLGSRTFNLSDGEDPVAVAQGNIVANRFEIEVTGTGDAEFNMVEIEVNDMVNIVERG